MARFPSRPRHGVRPVCALIAALLVATAAAGRAQPAPSAFDIYLNADMTHTANIGEALRLGLEAGLAVGADLFGGPEMRVVVRDHRNNLRRTGDLVERLARADRALAIVGGMHTPHYLRHGAAINEAGVPLLLPWSAGAALTRLSHGPRNHIFRVSVDDSKAAPFLAGRTARHGCTRVAALGLDNGWGRGNLQALDTALQGLGPDFVHADVVRVDAGRATLEARVARMQGAAPDCVVLVLGARTTAHAANALAAWQTPPDVLSHWGLFGGGFAPAVRDRTWARVNLAVLATCALEREDARRGPLARALAAVSRDHPGIDSLRQLPSPIAFAHGHDIGLILRAAVVQASADRAWGQGRAARGAALREALQDLRVPVEGLVKRYERPFAPTAPDAPDGHEALGFDDLCLVRVDESGGVSRYGWPRRP